MKELRIALAQYEHGRDPVPIVAEAKNAGAEIVAFPEMYSNGYARFDPSEPDAAEQWPKGAQSANGPFVRRFREAAKQNHVYVVATFLEAAQPKPFNAALLIGPDGQGILHHRKVHICDFDSPEAACDRGQDFKTAEIQTEAGKARLGLMICMEREYPEAARSLSSVGAEIAVVPNCCDLARDAAVGDVRIAQTRGRAFETVMGIAVANYPAPRCDGHSFAVDPTGALLAMADDSAGITIVNFDLDFICRMRAQEHFRWRL